MSARPRSFALLRRALLLLWCALPLIGTGALLRTPAALFTEGALGALLALLEPTILVMIALWGGVTVTLSVIKIFPSWPALLCLIPLLSLLGHRLQYQRSRQIGEALSARSVIRVVSWNVGRLGESSLRRAETIPARLRCAVDQLSKRPFDLLALQEVSARRIAALQVELALSCRQVDYNGRGDLDAGGVAVCTPREGRWRLIGGQPLQLGEDWYGLFGELSDGVNRLNLISLHLHPPRLKLRSVIQALLQVFSGELEPIQRQWARLERNSVLQAREIIRLIEQVDSFSDPTIITGDFNSAPGTKAYAPLELSWSDGWRLRRFGLGATRWQGVIPTRIDQLYLPHQSVHLREIEVLPSDCSDHLPLTATLSFRAAMTKTQGSGETEEPTSLINDQRHHPSEAVQREERQERPAPPTERTTEHRQGAQTLKSDGEEDQE